MFDVLDDTIVAISSAIGHSPRGIVRLCGPDAIRLAGALFTPDEAPPLRDRKGHTCCLGRLSLMPGQDEPTVPCEAYLFRAPRSYTQQDIVELHTLGSPPILSMVMQTCFAGGARLAEPGEFTARAFFAGGLNLSEVEGVAALIHAESDAQLRAGERLLHGVLSRRAHALQQRLTDLLALVEADIDFAEEPINFVSPDQLRSTATGLRDDIRELLDASQSTERLETLPRVMLAGPPNVGKSSLLNRLTGLDRAICSPLPGTTRDVLTAPLKMPTGEAILVDAAGLGRDETAIDRLADAAVHEAATEADLIVFVVDISLDPLEPNATLLARLPATPRLVVANKVDLVNRASLIDRIATLSAAELKPHLLVSAKTGEGCDQLVVAIENALHADVTETATDAVALNSRHRAALVAVTEALDRAIALTEGLTETLDAGELIAVELHQASDELAGIAGQVVTDDLLGRIFEGFCIGK